MLKQIEMKWSSSSKSEECNVKISRTPPLEFENWSGLEPADTDQFLHRNNAPPHFFVGSRFPQTLKEIPATREDSTFPSFQSKTTGSSSSSHHDFDSLETLFSEDISEEDIFACSSFMEPTQQEPWTGRDEETDLQTSIYKVVSAGFIVIPAGDVTSSIKGVMGLQERCPQETQHEDTIVANDKQPPSVCEVPSENLSKTHLGLSSQDLCGIQDMILEDLEHLLVESSVGAPPHNKDLSPFESFQVQADDQKRAPKNHLHGTTNLQSTKKEAEEERPFNSPPPDASSFSQTTSPAQQTVVVSPPIQVGQIECKGNGEEEKEEGDEVDGSLAALPKQQDDFAADGRSPAVSQEEKQQGCKNKQRSKKIKTKGGATTPTDKDILGGRGGRTNHFAGNKRYRSELTDELKALYKAGDKIRKTDISELFVQHVHGYGGRFLTQKEGLWFEILDEEARKRVAQALRENNTPEARAAKRQRFISNQRKNKNKSNPSGQQSRRKGKNQKRFDP